MNNVYKNLLAIFLSLCVVQIVAQTNTVGVVNISDKAQEGYTLFAPNSSKATYLIDNCGNVVNRWLSQRNPGLAAYLMPNGDLVRTRRESNNTFFAGGTGGGIEIFDWSGSLKWEFVLANEQFILHHDIAVMPNGNILAIAYEAITRAESIGLGRELDITPTNGMWTDKIIEIKPLADNQFEIVWEWRAIDHIVQNINPNLSNFGALEDNPGKLNFNFHIPGQGSNSSSDWMHSNAIDYNPVLDQIILNSRNFKEFYIIDHSTTTEEAKGSEGGVFGKGGDFLYRWGNPAAYNQGGINDQQLYSQHDAHWIDAGLKDEGKIFVFNNGIDRPGGSISSVDLISPPIKLDGTYQKTEGQPFGPLKAEWQYGLEPDHISIYSARISGVSRLPNGNTVITVGGDGRILELDQKLEVAWDYIIPLAGDNPIEQGDVTSLNSAFRSYRYPLDYPPFLENDIDTGSPIELKPNNQFCLALPVDDNINISYPFELVNTLINDNLIIKSNENIDITIFDINGRQQFAQKLTKGTQYLNVHALPAGMYYVQLMNTKNSILQPLRFIKLN